MNNTIKILVLSLFLLLLDTKIKAQKTVVLVEDEHIPLYSFLDEKQKYKGFYIDLIEALLGENNILFTNDATQKSDIILYQVTKKIPENYQFIPFPQRMNYMVFVRNKQNISSLSELYDKKIIIKKNDLPYKVLYEYRTSHILTVQNYTETLELLQLGIHDAAILPYQIGMDIIKQKKLKGIDFLNIPFLIENSGIAVKKEKKELILLIKNNLNELIKSGKFEKIESHWFWSTRKKSNKQFFMYILIFILLIVGIFLIFLQKFTRKEIDKVTSNYVDYISKMNKEWLEIDINSPLVEKLLDIPYYSVIINDKNGRIVLSNTTFDEEYNLKNKENNVYFIDELFDKRFAEELKKSDKELFSDVKTLIVKELSWQIKDRIEKKWVIKAPIKLKSFEGNYILSIILNPMIEGVALLEKLSEDLLFQSLVDTLPDLIFYKNTKGEYLGGNKAFSEKINKYPKEYIGKVDEDIFSEDLVKQYKEADEIVFETQKIWKGKDKEINNGIEKHYENTKIPLKDKTGKMFGLVGISHDITNYYLVEKQLELAKKQAEESNKIKLSFLTNMSHEIRTPMNTIIGFSDLMADPDITYDQRMEIIGIIKSNGFRLTDVIDDIIDISMIEAGQIYIKHNVFDLNAAIQEIYKYAENKKIQLEKELIDISCNFGVIQDNFNIISDAFRIKQALKNLINIAVRYSESETINLGYIVENKNVIIYIQNDKPLLNYQQIKNFFEQQMEQEFVDQQNISELSFIIAKSIIERLEGKLIYDDYNNGKTNFYFQLPLQQATVTKKISTPIPNEDYPDWNGKSILIAEDEILNFELLKNIIIKTGANIFQANNGQEAVFIYKNNHIDLVLMDIKMPILDGFEASQLILEENPNAIIIAQTAFDLQYDKKRCNQLGIRQIMIKPIDHLELYYLGNKYLKTNE